MYEVRVYGHSDDCIEVAGEIEAEFSPHDEEKPTYLAFSNGAVVSIEYTKDGEWKILVHITPPGGSVLIYPVNSDQAKEKNDYTDLAVIQSEAPITHFIAGHTFTRKD